LVIFSSSNGSTSSAFGVLTLSVGWQEELPAHKNWVMSYCLEWSANYLHMVHYLSLH